MDVVATLIVVAVALYLLSPVIRGFKQGLRGDSGKMICAACGTQALPVTKVKGSLVLEIVLWLCFIVPGLIYSIWRLSSKFQACEACGQQGLIPLSSPNGKRLAEQYSEGRRP